MHQQIHDALKKAFQLGQTYWQQADSDSFIQHRKSDETHAQFLKLCEDTLNNLTEKDKLQAEGKHPAPCARHCEAQAFSIEIRNLRSEITTLRQKTIQFGGKI